MKILALTIVSGSIAAERGNGASLSASFDKVRFEEPEGCVRPFSRTISGEIVRKDGRDRSFLIDFAQEAGSIKLLQAAEILTRSNLNRQCGWED